MERLTFEGNFCDIAQCDCVRGGSFCEDGYCSQRKVWERLKKYEDADVAPVAHGRWEFLGPNRLVRECMCGTCSVCKVRSKYIVNVKLCPNCGAQMDGETHGEN